MLTCSRPKDGFGTLLSTLSISLSWLVFWTIMASLPWVSLQHTELHVSYTQYAARPLPRELCAMTCTMSWLFFPTESSSLEQRGHSQSHWQCILSFSLHTSMPKFDKWLLSLWYIDCDLISPLFRICKFFGFLNFFFINYTDNHTLKIFTYIRDPEVPEEKVLIDNSCVYSNMNLCR